jgi:hypothetical protein
VKKAYQAVHFVLDCGALLAGDGHAHVLDAGEALLPRHLGGEGPLHGLALLPRQGGAPLAGHSLALLPAPSALIQASQKKRGSVNNFYFLSVGREYCKAYLNKIASQKMVTWSTSSLYLVRKEKFTNVLICVLYMYVKREER